jgi:hypothetical protein
MGVRITIAWLHSIGMHTGEELNPTAVSVSGGGCVRWLLKNR